jgi:hypothetical protein
MNKGVKFTQIAADANGGLYALDGDGQMWHYGPRITAGAHTLSGDDRFLRSQYVWTPIAAPEKGASE